jgi:hypothetical protein
MPEYITLVEIDFDSGMRRYDFFGTRTTGGFYESKVISIGSITREIPLLAGEACIADTSITLSDSDRSLQVLRGTEAWYGRTVRIKFGDALLGIASFETVFTGKINGESVDSDGNYTITVRDASYVKLKTTIAGTLSFADFPDMPQRQYPVLAPIIYGEVSSASTSGVGAVPCYLVTQSNPFRYVVAQHACKSIDNVYLYGVLIDPGDYSVTQSNVNSKTYTFIDFTTDQRDLLRSNEVEITADVKGRTDDATSSGTLITDPILALKDFLLNHTDILYSECSASGFASSAAISAANSYLIGAWIGDSSKTVLDVVNAFAQSFLIQFYVDKDGLFTASILIASEFYNFTGTYPIITDQADILRSSFSVSFNDDNYIASSLQYFYQERWQTQQFEQASIQRTTDEKLNIGREITRQQEYAYIRDIETAHKVSATRLLFLRESLQSARFSLPIEQYGLDLNDYVSVTHFRGISLDGLGYQNEVFRILQLGLEFNPSGMMVSTMAVRVPDAPEYADSHCDEHTDGYADIAHTDVTENHTHGDVAAYTTPHADYVVGNYIDIYNGYGHGDQYFDTYYDQEATSVSHTDTYVDIQHGDVALCDEILGSLYHGDFTCDSDNPTSMFS